MFSFQIKSSTLLHTCAKIISSQHDIVNNFLHKPFEVSLLSLKLHKTLIFFTFTVDSSKKLLRPLFWKFILKTLKRFFPFLFITYKLERTEFKYGIHNNRSPLIQKTVRLCWKSVPWKLFCFSWRKNKYWLALLSVVFRQ